MKAAIWSIAVFLATLSCGESFLIERTPVVPYFGVRFNDKCPEPLAVECISDIQITTRDCEKAIKDLADVTDKLSCIKDLLNDREACLPCICNYTDKYVKIDGCE